MVKLKTGEEISWKEAGKRFKEGVANITPIQKAQNERWSTFVIMMGFITAVVMLIITWDAIGLVSYGLILIFGGNAWSSFMKFLGYNKYIKSLKTMEVSSVDVGSILDSLDNKIGVKESERED